VEKGDNLRAVAHFTRILDLDPLSGAQGDMS
jgi:hypothetical protein